MKYIYLFVCLFGCTIQHEIPPIEINIGIDDCLVCAPYCSEDNLGICVDTNADQCNNCQPTCFFGREPLSLICNNNSDLICVNNFGTEILVPVICTKER